ncbi:MAG TPA: phosphatase PAP2 family protein [Pseudomonadales bacterium]|nr:phosphatase PAP2 family protein [Pseudomonadales bacterium]
MKDWDYAVLALADAARAPWLDSFFLAITSLGSLAVLLPLAVLVWWWRGDKKANFVLLALIGSSALVHAVKLITVRPRPEFFPPLIAMPGDASFPSAHAMQATAFALAWLMQPGKSPGIVESAILLTVVALVGISRLYLQVHFPSDVVVGVIFATLWVLLLRKLLAWRECKQ